MEIQPQPEGNVVISGPPIAEPVPQVAPKVDGPLDRLSQQRSELLSRKPLEEKTFDRSRFENLQTEIALVGESYRRTPIPKEGFTLRFKEPTFVTMIGLEVEPAGRIVALRIRDLDGVEHPATPIREGKSQVVSLGFWVTEIQIGISAQWKKRSFDYLKALAVRGFDLDQKALVSVEEKIQEWQQAWSTFSEGAEKELASIAEAQRVLQSERAAFQQQVQQDQESRTKVLEDHASQVTSLITQTAEKRKELDAVQADLQPRQVQIAALKNEITTLEASKKSAETETEGHRKASTELKAEIDTRKANLEILAKKTAKAETRLKELNSNINLFAVDMAGYGEMGNRQMAIYGLVFVVVLVLGYLLTGYSLDAASEIWKEYVKNPTLMSVPVLLGLRAGFIAIVCTVLSGLSMIAYQLLNRIIAIQDGKLQLSAASILAKDAVEAGVSGKGYTKDEETAVFIAFRMSIIKDFLAGKFKKASSEEKDPNLKPIATTEMDAAKLLLNVAKESVKAVSKN